jgi:hypothetical protein
MADVTKNQIKRNAGTTITVVNGTESQTIVYDRSDENILIHVQNTNTANACRIKIAGNGTGAGTTGDLNIDIAGSGETAVVLESSRFKSALTGKVTFKILDQDDSSFSGDKSKVKIRVFDMPKGLTD